MIEISIVVASLISNLIVKFVKPPKTESLTEEDLNRRAMYIRIISAIFGLATMLITYTLTGGSLDATQISTYLNIIVGGIITFATSQGIYHIATK